MTALRCVKAALAGLLRWRRPKNPKASCKPWITGCKSPTRDTNGQKILHQLTSGSSNMQDEQQVRAVIEKYFDALYHGDTALFREVLHPRVQLFSATDGELVNLTLEPYMELVSGRPSPASRNDRREDEVLSVEIASPTTAHARVKDMYLPKKFTDELSFIKIDGKWRIIAKIWHFCI
jgi:Putative lumazine-binding